jgi:acylphosphatase
MKKAVRIHIKGRVQGVNFRYYTQRTAQSLSITGFARNLDDGSVLIEAQGEEQNLMEFIRWCHKGPTWARVDNVKTENIQEINNQGFTIDG